MKTVLPIALVIAISGALCVRDYWQARNRPPVARPDPCEEDRILDALARELDSELDRRRSRPVRMTAS